MGACLSSSARNRSKDSFGYSRRRSSKITDFNQSSAASTNRIIIEEVKSKSRPNSGNRKTHKKGIVVASFLRKSSIVTEATSAVINDPEKSNEDINLIRGALNQHFMFADLPEEIIQAIIGTMKMYSIDPFQLVYEEGTPGTHFFIVCRGKCEAKVKNVSKGIIRKGGSFGELALMHDSKRTNSVWTLDKTKLWGIDRYDFRNAVESINSKRYEENKKFIESVPLLQILTNIQKESLLAVLKHQHFNANVKIVSEGEPGDLFYIIKDGNVNCSVQGKMVRQMGKGDFFGEQALLYNCKRTATITSNTKVRLLSLGRDDLIRVLGDQLQLIIYKNSQRIAIENSSYLKALTKTQEEAVISKMHIVTYNNQEIVIPKGMPAGQKLWVIVRGAVLTQDTGKRINSLTCIGDAELLSNAETTYKENYIAEGTVDIEEITREAFETCIGGKLNKVKSQNEVLKIMRSVHIFRSLPTNKLESLVNTIFIQTYENKQVIFEENAPGDAFYIVKSGQVDIIKDSTVIRTISRHCYFGERSIILNEKRTATVAANGKTKV